jgi:lipopolysaccharide/colanic/teichoic acid biosynthesis glycosyltransferase
MGKLFFYFKFRTMRPGTDSLRYDPSLQAQNLRTGSPLVKLRDDPRVTRIGAWLRRFSLDEFPEFFLVLKGDMSLVGPRPHLPEEVARYQQHHKQVLYMKPGITGLSQISGRSDLEFEDEVRLDVFYMEHWSLWLDLVILIKTPFRLLQKRNAL